MGTLHTFSPKKKPSGAPVGDVTRGPAEILLFTGVRYERNTTMSLSAEYERKIKRRRKG